MGDGLRPKWVLAAAEGSSISTTPPSARNASSARACCTRMWSELDAAGVAAEVVDENFCHTLLDDPHACAVGLVSETWAPGVGRFEDPGLLIDFSETPGAVPRGPCLCGEHTRELLREHGYSDDEIDALAADGAVLDAPRVRMSA